MAQGMVAVVAGCVEVMGATILVAVNLEKDDALELGVERLKQQDGPKGKGINQVKVKVKVKVPVLA